MSPNMYEMGRIRNAMNPSMISEDNVNLMFPNKTMLQGNRRVNVNSHPLLKPSNMRNRQQLSNTLFGNTRPMVSRRPNNLNKIPRGIVNNRRRQLNTRPSMARPSNNGRRMNMSNNRRRLLETRQRLTNMTTQRLNLANKAYALRNQKVQANSNMQQLVARRDANKQRALANIDARYKPQINRLTANIAKLNQNLKETRSQINMLGKSQNYKSAKANMGKYIRMNNGSYRRGYMNSVKSGMQGLRNRFFKRK